MWDLKGFRPIFITINSSLWCIIMMWIRSHGVGLINMNRYGNSKAHISAQRCKFLSKKNLQKTFKMKLSW